MRTGASPVPTLWDIPHSATVLPPFYRAGLLFERRTELDVAAAFHTNARNQVLAGLAKFNA